MIFRSFLVGFYTGVVLMYYILGNGSDLGIIVNVILVILNNGLLIRDWLK